MAITMPEKVGTRERMVRVYQEALQVLVEDATRDGRTLEEAIVAGDAAVPLLAARAG